MYAFARLLTLDVVLFQPPSVAFFIECRCIYDLEMLALAEALDKLRLWCSRAKSVKCLIDNKL